MLVRGLSSSHLCVGGHSALTGDREAHLLTAWLSSISKGIQILGLLNVPWKFVPQVHPLESRMVNLPPSPRSTQVTCIALEAQLFH